MEDREMSAMEATDAMSTASGGDQEVTVAPTHDAESTVEMTEPAHDGAGEGMTDNTDGEGEPAVPTAEVGTTTADENPRWEDEEQSTANEITSEPLDWTELCAAYPGVDPTRMEQDLAVCALARGEVRPTPRQAYELAHMDAIVDARVAEQLAEQVAEQVAEQLAEQLAHAVREGEARLLEHIRTCGQRPVENGVRAAAGVRMHPAVGRLTRSDRAALARRAERGETIRL